MCLIAAGGVTGAVTVVTQLSTCRQYSASMLALVMVAATVTMARAIMARATSVTTAVGNLADLSVRPDDAIRGVTRVAFLRVTRRTA
jgi:hypothetical protein